MICSLCERPIPRELESRHHLVPKKHGGHKGPKVVLHDICHRQIHSLFREKVLARKLDTIEKLIEQPNMQRFIVWVQKKPNWFNPRSKRRY